MVTRIFSHNVRNGLVASSNNLSTSMIMLNQTQTRQFARPDDFDKQSRQQFLMRELKENPEFFKAFPHLQKGLDRFTEEGQQEDGVKKDDQKMNHIETIFNEYKEVEPVSFKKKFEDKQFFESLLHHRNKELTPEQPEEILRDNEMHFVEGSNVSTDGPFKYMPEDRIDHVHMEVDRRMQELEDSGLTRMEILHNDTYKSEQQLPLGDDPFFQMIKNSRVAREMLIKPNEHFTADRIIEKALRQDVGVDPSNSMPARDWQYLDRENPQDISWDYKKKYRDKTPTIDEGSYFAFGNVADKRQQQFDFEKEKPATFINRPLSRTELRKRFMRRINKKDLDWKDTALMVKFLNETGKLFNRYQSRLPTSTQKKVAKVIKKMRHLRLIPFSGLILPTDKIPLGNYIEDLEEMHRKTIDPVTGRMFLKHSLQESLKQKLPRQQQHMEERFEHLDNPNDFEDIEDQKNAARQERIIRDMPMDSEKLLPNMQQREWLAAQAYVLQKDGTVEDMKQTAEYFGKSFKDPNVGRLGAKIAYQSVSAKLEDNLNDFTAEDLFDNYLHEKSMQLDKFDRNPAEEEPPIDKPNAQIIAQLKNLTVQTRQGSLEEHKHRKSQQANEDVEAAEPVSSSEYDVRDLDTVKQMQNEIKDIMAEFGINQNVGKHSYENLKSKTR